jgi:tryptophanyl-tRNA synthetase
MQENEINPWSSENTVTIQRLFTEFGIEPITDAVADLSDIPFFMRRNIVFGHRDYEKIADAITHKKAFNVMTGFMPSGPPHLGHLMVMKEVVWHVNQGGQGFVGIADREAHAVRGLDWAQCEMYGKEYLKCLYALGYEGAVYAQSANRGLQDLAFLTSEKVNFSELSAIYGFESETSLAHAISVIHQVADILYPQVAQEPAPTLVPVGIDQDPHIRLTRGIAHKMRLFTIEDRGEYISVRSKNAPEEALSFVHKQFRGSKKYAGHVDIKGSSMELVERVVRDAELAEGGYAFVTPSATYHHFLPGLNGGKMSSSIPESFIGFTESSKVVHKKIMGAVTRGRQTLAEQKELGGQPDSCPVFLLNLFHMIEDDTELNEVRQQCLIGELMCGQCKKDTAARVEAFLSDFNSRIDAVSHMVSDAYKR